MSQADGTIANDTGSNVRTDMQNQVQAALSTSKGNSAPSTKYAGQHYIEDQSPSATIWTEKVWDGADGIALWYINTSSNVAYPVSAMPLLGFSAQGSPVMTGDIRTTAVTAVPGASNTNTGYNLAANGTLHLSNNGSYVASFNRNSSGVILNVALSGATVGSISVSGSSTAYNTSSDPRLKTNVETIDWRDAVTILARLRPVWFNWISNPMGNRVDGFLSTEVEDVLPHLVTGQRDATEMVTHKAVLDAKGQVVRDENGQPKLIPLAQPFERIVPQGIDQAKLTPLLTAIVNGLVPHVLALEERLAALEAARGA